MNRFSLILYKDKRISNFFINYYNNKIFLSFFISIVCALSSAYLLLFSSTHLLFDKPLEFIDYIIKSFPIISIIISQYYFFLIHTNKLLSNKQRLLNYGLFFILYNFILLIWLNDAMYLHAGLPFYFSILITLAFAIYNSIFIIIAVYFCKSLLFIPFAWVIAEYLRGYFFTGFPWLTLGYSFVDTPFIIIAPYLGVYGVSLCVLLFGYSLYFITKLVYTKKLYYFILPSIMIVIISGSYLVWINYLNVNVLQNPSKSINVRIIQGNISQNKKFSRDSLYTTMYKHLDLMFSKTKLDKLDLIITPETAFPLVINDMPIKILQVMQNNVLQNDYNILFGAAGINNLQYTNSLFLLNKQHLTIEKLIRYDKYHLVPFGEFVPTGFTWFVNTLVMPMGNFARGNLIQPLFKFKDIKFSANICYELLFGEEMAVVNQNLNPDFFVNSTNLAWFGKEALYQFLHIGRMRAMELQKPIIIANNSGISAVILPNTRIISMIDVDKNGFIDVKLPILNNREYTIYSKYMNYLVILLCVGVLVFGYFYKK